MKIRPSVILFIVLIAALIVLVLSHGKKPLADLPKVLIETNEAPSPAIAQSQPVGIVVNTNARTPRPATNVFQTQSSGKSEQMQNILATQNDIPINFYGRIEDQFGGVVANATINFSVGVYNGYESTEKRGQVMADAKGFFTISGYKCSSLSRPFNCDDNFLAQLLLRF